MIIVHIIPLQYNIYLKRKHINIREPDDGPDDLEPFKCREAELKNK